MPATVWKGYLSFGLVSFPVRLFSAARAEAVHFHMLHKKDLSRIKEVWYCAEEDKAVERSEIVKGYEVEKDEYVTVGDEELKEIAPTTATTMEVLQFVASDDVDPLTSKALITSRPKRRSASLMPCSWRRLKRPTATRSRKSPCTIASTSY